jgi:SAM-dependent methyltransferase
MKAAALSFLVCPDCRDKLELRKRAQHGAEILEGTLSCRRCKAEYPVSRGVPRFVQAGIYASSFGKQWNWFREVQIDSRNGTRESEQALYAATGWTPEDYRGRLVLDAGAGAGRFAEVAAKHGGTVVCVDLTSAIDAAYANIGERENVHLVQADIFKLPFRDGTFDLGYSIGVLHHTSDPRAAFRRVAAAVRKGGGFATYLYHGYGPAHRMSDLIRTVTTRLPLRVMFVLSALAVALYYVHRVPVLGKVSRMLLPISMHPDWRWRWLDTFDWYTPRYQWKFLYPEIFRWFRESGFVDIEIFDDPIRMRGVKTETKRPRALQNAYGELQGSNT